MDSKAILREDCHKRKSWVPLSSLISIQSGVSLSDTVSAVKKRSIVDIRCLASASRAEHDQPGQSTASEACRCNLEVSNMALSISCIFSQCMLLDACSVLIVWMCLELVVVQASKKRACNPPPLLRLMFLSLSAND